ncbi:Secretion-regulating guanine nucleotide exchange factor [Thelohanellus kitauei]|uniref:Secretion-regulating guanine nucleotide exchange factor n=1 Tax=Thelohanellus kitauei TaxID=669202 RepID=A0A0C2MU38_THEKT|nr:Secretion-regulating guanine nucleotide exchange factor [Thelohanellus kitauei]
MSLLFLVLLLLTLDSNKIYVWGRNDFGQCHGFNHPCPLTELHLSMGRSEISCGAEHSLIYDTERSSLFSFGWNEHGNCCLVDGDFVRIAKTPVLPDCPKSSVMLGSGYSHSFLYFY